MIVGTAGVVVGADVVDGVELGADVVVIVVCSGLVSDGSVDVDSAGAVVVAEVVLGTGVVVGTDDVDGVVVGADVVDGVELGADVVVIVVCSGLVSDGSVDVDSDGTDDVVTVGASGVVVGSDDVVIVGAGVVVVGSVTVVSDVDEPVKKLVIVEMIEVVVLS